MPLSFRTLFFVVFVCFITAPRESSAARHRRPPIARRGTQLQIDVLEARLVRRQTSLAKYEPLHGCYVGAYAEADELLDEHAGSAMREVSFGVRTGKHLATAFTYCSYGQRFPLRWARSLLEAGIAPHIAFEPNDGLTVVHDDLYLQRWAQDAAACGGPVFVRWASEMNGDWTAYSGNPFLYREKWRLVHQVFAREAPNVALIWCVFTTPSRNWDLYYPGDQYVDWAGINIYSVLHHDNKLNRPAAQESPSEMLAGFYKKYASRKPIAICEFGATHREELDRAEDGSSFAIQKIRDMYLSLPRIYPRVKLIDIFDLNCLAHAPAGRKLNDYCVTDHPAVLQAFRECVRYPYFLGWVEASSTVDRPVELFVPLSSGQKLRGTATLAAVCSTRLIRAITSLKIDGSIIASATAPGTLPYTITVDHWTPGPHLLTAELLDSKGSVAARLTRRVVFSPAPGASELLPAPGEIEITGTVARVGPRRRRVDVWVRTLTLPRNRHITLNRPRLKTVLLPWIDSRLKPGAGVVATGVDLGSGRTLPARTAASLPAPQ